MKTLLSLLLVAALAAAGGWWFGVHQSAPAPAPHLAADRPLYQCPMHPQVQAEQPGRCSLCGMELVLVSRAPGHPAGTVPATDLVMLPPGSPHALGVKTAAVRRQPLARTLRVAGTINDDDSRHRVLSAYTGGRIEKLFVNYEGAEVQAGQPLATWYSKELQNAVREYKAIYPQGPSPLRTSWEVRLRQLGLNDDQLAHAHERPESEVYIELRAPVTGTVTKRYVYEGQYVQEGERLFEIADFSVMWFQFIAYEQDLPLLHPGLPVTISSASLPGKAIVSEIKFINPNLDDTTRSARVRVEFRNPVSAEGLHRGHEVLHNLYAQAEVQLDAPAVLAVPREAVLWSGQEPRVYVEQEPGTYQQRRVILGRPGDDVWEILEGVREGERVVASGNMLIDSQAQLSHLGPPPGEAPAAPAALLTPAEQESLAAYLAALARASEALARDDLLAYQKAVAHLPEPPAGLPVAPPPATTPDLATARREFLPVSQTVATYALPRRSHFPGLHIFRCPMSEQVGGGAPNDARWVQFTPELQNPFFGPEMNFCGVEVK